MPTITKKDKLQLTEQCIAAARELKELLPEGQKPIPYITAHLTEFSNEKEKYKLYRFFEWGMPNTKILEAVKKLSANLKRAKTKAKKAA
jgi:hypothetical protein